MEPGCGEDRALWGGEGARVKAWIDKIAVERAAGPVAKPSVPRPRI